MSKKRHDDIARRVGEIVDRETTERVMAIVCDVMRFDPANQSALVSRSKAYVAKRAAALGVSEYVASGRQAYYQRTRQKQPDLKANSAIGSTASTTP